MSVAGAYAAGGYAAGIYAAGALGITSTPTGLPLVFRPERAELEQHLDAILEPVARAVTVTQLQVDAAVTDATRRPVLVDEPSQAGIAPVGRSVKFNTRRAVRVAEFATGATVAAVGRAATVRDQPADTHVPAAPARAITADQERDVTVKPNPTEASPR